LSSTDQKNVDNMFSGFSSAAAAAIDGKDAMTQALD
jgi:hypothetical protein